MSTEPEMEQKYFALMIKCKSEKKRFKVTFGRSVLTSPQLILIVPHLIFF
jgi:hypothetical protein